MKLRRSLGYSGLKTSEVVSVAVDDIGIEPDLLAKAAMVGGQVQLVMSGIS